MRRTQLAAALLVCAVIGFPRAGWAQDATRPTILNVTMDAAGDQLTIVGTGFGAAPVVTIDGQPVPVLAGASDTQVTVVTPAVLLTTPGTYRLTVVDSVRQVGEVFVVASRAGLVPAVGLTTSGTSAAPSGAGIATVQPRATSAVAATSSGSSGAPVGTFTVFEDSATPFRTALGSGALAANPATGSTAVYNTASGGDALFTNTSGSSNTASGDYALRFNETGSANTASGYAALYSNHGDFNAALGQGARSIRTTRVATTRPSAIRPVNTRRPGITTCLSART